MMTPLHMHQIRAANRVHRHLAQWAASDLALAALAERFPGFDPEATLLKVVTINALYGTRVMALMRMADHVRQTVAACNLATAGPELVDAIAALPTSTIQKTRRAI